MKDLERRRRARRGEAAAALAIPAWVCPCALFAAGLAAFADGILGAFQFDDRGNILNNPAIRNLWPPWSIFLAKTQAPVAGHPLVALSLAVNWAISADRPWSYHAFNIGVHLAASLALWGILRRTLAKERFSAAIRSRADATAFAAALLWTVHPLQTESVTFLIQRAESMMGLFYLLALYAFIRSAREPARRFWPAASIVACALGMACKEVMSTAPLMIFLYDAIFEAGSPREALRRCWRFHAAMASTWIVLAGSMALASGNPTLGFSERNFGAVEYARSQFAVILRYLRLTAWPSPLVLDYWQAPAASWAEAAAPMICVLALAALTGIALARWPAWGFFGAWFFVILAPSSSVVPIADLCFEHRMYLPLAAPLVLAVLAASALLDQIFGTESRARARWAGGILGIAALTLGLLTARRNLDYRDETSMWRDVVRKRPENPRAWQNLGALLYAQNHPAEAIDALTKSAELRPDYAAAQYGLGKALYQTGRQEDGIARLREAVRLQPDLADAQSMLGFALAQRGALAEAAERLAESVRLKPDDALTQANLGGTLIGLGRPAEAEAHLLRALELRPRYASAFLSLGIAQERLGRPGEAAASYAKALEADPNLAEARRRLDAIRPPAR